MSVKEVTPELVEKEAFKTKKESNEICECGHDKKDHRNIGKKLFGDECMIYYCSCKKFKPIIINDNIPQNNFETPTDPVTDKAPTQNHSPFSPKKIDEEPDVKVIAESSRSAPSGSESNLSDKIDWADGGDHNIKSEYVKEFIKKLKEELNNRIKIYQKYIKEHEECIQESVLCAQLKTIIKVIDKLAGKELI